MYLSQTAEYALRGAACLAQLPEGEALTARAVAERTGVPVHYLSKLLRRMVVAGVLDAQKGHGGGFRLARPPAEVTFYEVLSAVDFLLEPDRCVFGHAQCNAADPCPLHHAWSSLNQSIVSWAQEHTLGDVGVLRQIRKRKTSQ